jgi:hypothetical protein
MKYHFTQFQIDEDIIMFVDTRTEDQFTNLFTKQQIVKRHTEDCKQLGLDLKQTRPFLFEEECWDRHIMDFRYCIFDIWN